MSCFDDGHASGRPGCGGARLRAFEDGDLGAGLRQPPAGGEAADAAADDDDLHDSPKCCTAAATRVPAVTKQSAPKA